MLREDTFVRQLSKKISINGIQLAKFVLLIGEHHQYTWD